MTYFLVFYISHLLNFSCYLYKEVMSYSFGQIFSFFTHETCMLDKLLNSQFLNS